MHVLIGPRICQIAHLLQQQWILKDALYGFDQIRFQGAAVLLLGIACGKELLQGMVAFIWKCAGNAKIAKMGEMTKIANDRQDSAGGSGARGKEREGTFDCKSRHLANDLISMRFTCPLIAQQRWPISTGSTGRCSYKDGAASLSHPTSPTPFHHLSG